MSIAWNAIYDRLQREALEKGVCNKIMSKGGYGRLADYHYCGGTVVGNHGRCWKHQFD